MANLKELEYKVDELVDINIQACAALEDADLGIANYMPDEETEGQFRILLAIYLLYVAISDGDISKKELEIFNSLVDFTADKEAALKVVEASGVRNAAFAKAVPVILRAFVHADNESCSSEAEYPFSLSLYELFATAGVYMMAVDEKVDATEYERLMEYLNTMYTFIKQNLKMNMSDVKSPNELVQSVLDKAEIEVNISSNSDEEEKADDEAYDGETTLEDLINELNSMIGLDEVKYDVTSLTNLLRIKALREQAGLAMPPVSMHLVFSGNPGTGKTTVARLLAKIYNKIGVLSKGQLVETDRSGLVGGYVGQTALKVTEVIDRAKGGVLFIDEAYSLTPERSDNDYGSEAVDTLVKAMEDNREDLIVIVAGYPELMERFLTSNPGLKSRFNKFINFRDYNPDELTQIFLEFCKKHGYRASRPALEYVNAFFNERCANKGDDFANAREVRNLFEYALSRQANRVILINNPTQNDLTLLKRADVSGEDINLGKEQYMAQMVINDLNRPKRYGIYEEDAEIYVDELEMSAIVNDVLSRNQICRVKDVLDYIDSGKRLSKMNGMNDDIVSELIKGLEKLGFEQ